MGVACSSITNSIPAKVQLQPVTKTIYYPVNGITSEKIFASLEANSPKTPLAGRDEFTAGLTEIEPLFKYTLAGNSPCVLSSNTLAINFTVTIPRHANTAVLSPQLSDKWHQFAANIALHEQTHVDIVLATLKEFAEVAPNSAPNCNQLESRIENSWDLTVELIDEQQEEFHAYELTRLNAALAPLQSQLADAEAELARLDNELDAFNTQKDRLASQIHMTESLYGRNGAPAAIYNDYKLTINRHNALIDESNAIVISYNEVRARANRIIEELNWVQ